MKTFGETQFSDGSGEVAIRTRAIPSIQFSFLFFFFLPNSRLVQSLELALRLGNLGSATAIVTELSNIAVKKKKEEECMPVGCVPSAAVAVQ